MGIAPMIEYRIWHIGNIPRIFSSEISKKQAEYDGVFMRAAWIGERLAESDDERTKQAWRNAPIEPEPTARNIWSLSTGSDSQITAFPPPWIFLMQEKAGR